MPGALRQHWSARPRSSIHPVTGSLAATDLGTLKPPSVCGARVYARPHRTAFARGVSASSDSLPGFSHVAPCDRCQPRLVKASAGASVRREVVTLVSCRAFSTCVACAVPLTRPLTSTNTLTKDVSPLAEVAGAIAVGEDQVDDKPCEMHILP